ncbi:8-oxo-dGTP pyrophosphatase MutT (NUDIX family) [Amycolatopsis bartoniae]|uniref:DNA mismatch repair protein MutT n=1 Tax=Amycolatopsis bartoniae TaxID=941986 RepID=A0A8H9IYL8_9PSEU|nr:NUDIX domain-containing protein [Amycolatopsis bartoniae]MBB2934412.1 8-oxo-dGTP pyrophosphatase MutT (NUDIX family) [Amycolatopsis bartoniae]TVT02943.1 NUDIX domain-containing protein [Amycolatopsis bartoniae]GHF47549.1 DNA mismatch repair protein MutT [Amycolatopsis bartoniae]
MIDKIAWLRVESGRVLTARSHGKDVYYLPGGKRETGESDVDTLVREVREELSVAIVPESAVHAGTFEAQADGKATTVRMTCYSADYTGELAPSSEIAELRWLTHADRDQVSAATRTIMDDLHRRGQLR